ncbi:hypothetical protein JD79_04455 [Geodermatophilus normandii]|uniref:DUF5642 domain-containing protein n=1 Tax=Geodermatophilus normandii TaxID=1137989 RepID=A0A317QRL3_9ACTN|nr:hypothetical protein [Geodermatophilus normandii]PWW25256.1 hypothetical protein JD79_04455 [Geodermatophilus normandii]
MARRTPVLLVAGCLLAAGCGDDALSAAGLTGSLATGPAGFVAVAARPEPTALCEPAPDGSGTTVPLPAELSGSPGAVSYARAEATLDAWAWSFPREEDAERVVTGAAGSLGGCGYVLSTAHDPDGDGTLDADGSAAQEAAPWSDGHWRGVRVHRQATGPGGSEQVERRLVSAGPVVVLVAHTADDADPAGPATVDAHLRDVAAALG